MGSSDILSLAKRFNSVLFDASISVVPFMVDGHLVGLIRSRLLPLIRAATSVLCEDGTAVNLDPGLDSFEKRTDAVDALLRKWRREENLSALKGWREERYDVRPWFSSGVLFSMERAAASLFGVLQYGVNLNGFVRDAEKGLCVWIQRRSQQKPTWPGKLDNMVSGGLTSGLGVLEAMHKESWEEAGLPRDLLPSIRSAGSVSFFYESERGLFPNTEFVFDIELPREFVPTPQDGEVEEFHLYSAEELAELVCSEDFKTSSAPITLDFLIRHGVITPENNDDYLQICEMLRVPLQTLFSGGSRFLRSPALQHQ